MREPDRSYSDYLNDIRDATEKAAKFVSGITFEQFQDNDEKLYAVIRTPTGKDRNDKPEKCIEKYME
jgi:hypothetical protein